MELKKLLLLLFVCLTVTSVKSQEKLDCDTNYKNALASLKEEVLKSMELLKPCVALGDAKAQALLGRIFMVKKTEEDDKKAFKLIKKSAKQGNAIAAGDLGILYKYGRGVKQNYNKARKWFKKGAELDNAKAAYSLGYLYLKGFGNIKQNYSEAVKWFEKSEYPMATYWLGVCYYYGYGVEKNRNTANKLLGANIDLSNLKLENHSTINDTILNQLGLSKEDASFSKTLKEEALNGKWEGVLLKFDWSKKHIEQKIPVTLAFVLDSEDQNLTYAIKVKNQHIEGDLSQIDNSIYFDDLFIKLPHARFKSEIPVELEYHFLSGDLSIREVGASSYLVGEIQNKIQQWNEDGALFVFVLKKIETFANSDKEVSEDALEALAKQKQNFIKLYPNPIENDLIISYTLEKPSFVRVAVTDFKSQKNTIVEKGVLQKSGTHNYLFNGTSLEKGMYVVSVFTDGIKKTRIIVKK